MVTSELRKSKGLKFPYDWSNPDIPDDVFLYRVLERGITEDIVRVAFRYGTEAVLAQAAVYKVTIEPVELAFLEHNLRVMHAVLQHYERS